MSEQEILKKIYTAYRQLLLNDRHLLDVDASERSLTHLLAIYLQAEFEGWDVDCEYNRDGHEVKSVYPWEEKAEELLREIEATPEGRRRDALVHKLENGLTVFPDIIIHHRGTSENLVVFEVKKSTYQGEDNDREKLQAYVTDLAYKNAFKVTLPTGKHLSALPEDFFAEHAAEQLSFFRNYIKPLEEL